MANHRCLHDVIFQHRCWGADSLRDCLPSIQAPDEPGFRRSQGAVMDLLCHEREVGSTSGEPGLALLCCHRSRLGFDINPTISCHDELGLIARILPDVDWPPPFHLRDEEPVLDRHPRRHAYRRHKAVSLADQQRVHQLVFHCCPRWEERLGNLVSPIGPLHKPHFACTLKMIMDLLHNEREIRRQAQEPSLALFRRNLTRCGFELDQGIILCFWQRLTLLPKLDGEPFSVLVIRNP